MINILYNDLKTLISSSNLVPEEQYRITDYVTTVSKANYTSAGYKFDIVVTALTTNTLYEYATLMTNSTETYFDANALLLYNIKYNVNNIIPGYYNDWVDVNGKGCIYYMVDDKGNEAPFDFKNIKHNGKFLFNNIVDGSDTSLTISEYNSIKEVIEDGVFTIPNVIFNNGCHSVTIDTNASEVIITECNNLQIGNNCSNSEYTEVSNVVVGNGVIDSELTLINGGEICDNNNGIIATNQTNLIIKDNNTTITLGSGSNGVIIDSNNTNVTIGTNAKDVYINGSKTIDLGNNVEQFNISSSYDVVVADDCKLFTLNETNHLTSTSGCESITAISNDYVALTEAVTNVNISEGLNNLVLDGSKLIGNDVKTIIQQDEKVVVINEQTNAEVVLVEDGTTTSNPNSYITDSPADNKTYGRKDGNWEEIDIPDGITDAPSDGLLYGRQDGDWEPIVTNGITDAPIDGTPYSRQDGDWVVAETGIEDAPNDGEVYGRKNNLWEIITTGGGGAGGGSTISITWSALKALRDAGTLVPGQSYRITDYVCTTVTTNTRSAGNQFDIIVTALDEGVLSENAIATYHEDDTYFSSNNANLESWKLKYCLNNDINRFAWADITNGKGVIYYMKDNYNNELPYDFKNIQYRKNSVWIYTFGRTVDNSLSAVCANNIINLYISSNKQRLNNITFGNGCHSNVFGVNCYSNTFGNECYSNTFGNDGSSNTFGSYCYSNTFGVNCGSNTFGDYCNSNNFGDYCSSNNFGDSCYSDTFGNNCIFNTFGYGCYSNTFGNEFNTNTIGSYCTLNIFGHNCNSNEFGDYCVSNTFGNDCFYNNFYDGTIGSTTPKNYIRYITLENGVSYNNFYSNLTTSYNYFLQRIIIKGFANTTATNTTISLTDTNTDYNWVVAKVSYGVVKQYCIEDLIP